MPLAILFILFFSSTLFAQDSNFVFLNKDSNYFKLWNRCPFYDSLFDKYNRLQISGNEQIKILHIGDSHIQADIFTNQLRNQFFNNFFHLIGSPAIGFPYGILKSNQPISLKVECTGNWEAYTSIKKNNYTPLGITAITNDSCAHKIFISINKKVLPNNNFNYLTIITNNIDTSIKITNPILTNLSLSALNDTIIFRTYKLAKYTDSIVLNIRLDTTNNKYFKLYGIIPFNDDPGIVYHTIGINGAKASTFLNTLIADFIALMKYDWLIISLGTNDVYSKHIDSIEIANNFRNLIKNIKRKNPYLPILLTTPMEHYYKRKYINTHVSFVREIILQIAKEECCSVWDLYDVAGGHYSMHHWYINKLATSDKLHLNKQGYQLVGNLFFEAFMNTYLNGFLAR
ncbi:MAG: GDSL-type esterase/lipase family protein [Bacteroidales bacterium]|nr:GDSL-type esterase/lipase family protein [Bacteroidales bacterium]